MASAALAAPVLFGLIVLVPGGWAPAPSGGWTALVAMVTVCCATTLATHLPRPGGGRWADLGCTPGAAVAAVIALASFVLLRSAPHDVSTAILALGISVFGLVQRLTPGTCPA